MSETTLTQWAAKADALKIEARAFIDGEYVAAASGNTRPTINPANGQVLAQVASCGPEDADRAVVSAKAVFEAGTWANMAPAERKKIMVRWAELIEANRDELALLESLDVGKPISDTLNVDVPAAARTIRWSGEAIDKCYDEIAPTPHDSLALVTRLPLGVVAVIGTPAISSRIRSATNCALSSVALVTAMRNSSPPNRAAKS